METNYIDTKLDEIRDMLLLNGKEVLNVKEAAVYLGCSEGWVQQQCSARTIPYYKKGVMKYFKKSELDEWRLEERIPTIRELSETDVFARRKKITKRL